MAGLADTSDLPNDPPDTGAASAELLPLRERWRLTADEFERLARGSGMSTDMLRAAYLVLVEDWDSGAAAAHITRKRLEKRNARVTESFGGRESDELPERYRVHTSQVSRALRTLKKRELHSRGVPSAGVDAVLNRWFAESVRLTADDGAEASARELRADLAFWLAQNDVQRPDAAGLMKPLTVGPSQFGTFMRLRGFTPHTGWGHTTYTGMVLIDRLRGEPGLLAKRAAQEQRAEAAAIAAKITGADL